MVEVPRVTTLDDWLFELVRVGVTIETYPLNESLLCIEGWVVPAPSHHKLLEGLMEISGASGAAEFIMSQGIDRFYLVHIVPYNDATRELWGWVEMMEINYTEDGKRDSIRCKLQQAGMHLKRQNYHCEAGYDPWGVGGVLDLTKDDFLHYLIDTTVYAANNIDINGDPRTWPAIWGTLNDPMATCHSAHPELANDIWTNEGYVMATLQDVAAKNGIVWELKPSLDKSSATISWTFDTLYPYGTDRTSGEQAVLIDDVWGVLPSGSMFIDWSGYGNSLQGEWGYMVYTDAAEVAKYGRFEVIGWGDNQEELDMLLAQAELKTGIKENLRLTAVTAQMQWMDKWDVGDIVRHSNSRLGLPEENARINAVHFIFNKPDPIMRLEIQWGERRPSLVSRIGLGYGSGSAYSLPAGGGGGGGGTGEGCYWSIGPNALDPSVHEISPRIPLDLVIYRADTGGQFFRVHCMNPSLFEGVLIYDNTGMPVFWFQPDGGSDTPKFDMSTANLYVKTIWCADWLHVDGQAVFNNMAGDVDFQVKGDTDNHLLFGDASTDRVGIGTASPAYKLDVNGTARASALIVPGTVTLNGVTYTWPGADSAGVLASNGVGALSFVPYSDNPGESASILACNASGKLTIVTLEAQDVKVVNELTLGDIIYLPPSSVTDGYYLKAIEDDGKWQLTWAAVSGGGGGESEHNLLSATHSDTDAGSVADGDIIIGNVTPKWSRLAITVPASGLRNVLGVDNGESRPSWKTVLDNTDPETLSVSASASSGTALVFARRDHVHAITSSSNPGAAASLLASDSNGRLQLTGLGIGASPASGIVIGDGLDIAVDTNVGTKIGTSASQKIGFWGVTPVTQREHIADPSADTSSLRTCCIAILLALEQVGILASS